MSLYQQLLDEFGYNEPFFTEEITYENYSRAWLYKELAKLCDDGAIVRFEKGVYYIPTQTIFGASTINPKKVIEKRYIRGAGRVYGYYGGQILMNQLGLSTQMPNVLEVYTNNEASKVRDVDIGRQKVRLRSSRVDVTENNAAVLSFLELMNTLSANDLDDAAKAIVTKYIDDNGITRKDITSFAPAFPDRTMRNLIESEVIYHVAR